MSVKKCNLDVPIENIRYITPKTNGEISDSITKNWTEQALECYLSKYDCKNCTIGQSSFSFVCQMPKVINVLVKDLGPPDKDKINKILA